MMEEYVYSHDRNTREPADHLFPKGTGVGTHLNIPRAREGVIPLTRASRRGNTPNQSLG